MRITRRIPYHTFQTKITQQHYMAFIISLINKRGHVTKGKNNTFMDVKVKAQVHICQLILSICPWLKRHLNFQFLKMIEGYWQRNSRVFQVPEIMNPRDKQFKLGIKFKHSQCQEHQEMFHSLNMVPNIHHSSRKVFID